MFFFEYYSVARNLSMPSVHSTTTACLVAAFVIGALAVTTAATSTVVPAFAGRIISPLAEAQFGASIDVDGDLIAVGATGPPPLPLPLYLCVPECVL